MDKPPVATTSEAASNTPEVSTTKPLPQPHAPPILTPFAGTPRLAALCIQHVDNLLTGIITKKLPQLFLVIGNAMALDDGYKILRAELGQRGTTKMGIF
jgi:hypothetical protein